MSDVPTYGPHDAEAAAAERVEIYPLRFGAEPILVPLPEAVLAQRRVINQLAAGKPRRQWERRDVPIGHRRG